MKNIVALCSAVVCGSGQFMNKQYIKGLFFFFFQAVFWFVELSTGTLNVITGNYPNKEVPGAFFREAGYFLSGFWGLITLGNTPRANTKQVVYDHSVSLMINGLITLVLFLIFLFIYIWGIRDAYKTRKQIENGIVKSSKEYLNSLWEDAFEYIMITPATILVMFVSMIPIMFAFLTSFTNYNTTNIPPKNLVEWVGFQTYVDVLTIPIWGKTFVGVFIWTVIWAFAATLTSYALGLFQAVLINNKFVKAKRFWRSIYILPWAIPSFVSLLVFRTMLNINGPINTILMNAGITDEKIGFLTDPTAARITLIVVNLWLGFPYFMALTSGVLNTISEEIYEAADLDGANGVQKFSAITLPMAIQATAPLIVMSITFNFNNFGFIYFLTDGGPANPAYQMAGKTDILISWIFKLTLDNRMYNYASVFSIFIFVIIASFSTWNLLRTRAFKES